MPSRGNKHLRCPDAESLAEALAHLCPNPKACADGWMACCPSHEDDNASLHITPADDKVLLHCFAGCSNAAIMGALALHERDLFVQHEEESARSIAAIYDYTDVQGTILHQTVRFEPKKFSQRRPNPDNPGQFIWNLKTIEPVLYHLRDVLQAIADEQPIYLVEGEKDADLLQLKGLTATCNPMGAGKWRPSYTETLRDAIVVILTDHDVAGKRHGEAIAQQLLNVAQEIKLIDAFHTDKSGSDVSDWIAAGGTREEFEAIIATVEPYTGTLAPVGWSSTTVPPASITAGMGAPWRKDLFQKKNGELTQNYFNVGQILKFHEYWQQPANSLWFDVVKQLHMCGNDVITKSRLVQMAEWFGQQERLPVTNLDLLRDCLYGQCEVFPRDPLQHWLNSLPAWDKTPRLESWLHTITQAPNEAYTSDTARILLVGMIARALNPGCIYRYVVILKGAENTGKSSLVRALATPQWYYAMKSDFESKEAHMEIQGAWVAELPELDSLNRTGETRLKAFVTLLDDSWIPKYANDRITVKRRTVFVGTTNDDIELKGQTGNTRFIIIETGAIDLLTFAEIRTQLFAEAKEYYLQHPDDWWEMSPEGFTRWESVREAHRKTSPYEDLLHRWLLTPVQDTMPPKVRTMTTWEEIASEALQMQTPEHWKDKSIQMDVANAMRALGWRHVKRRTNKGDPPKWIWDAPENWGVPF